VLPLAAAVARRRNGSRRLVAAALASIGAAELGRRRAGGAERFPLSGSLLAPAWIAERSLCAWLALGARARGGVRYGDGRLRHSATSPRQLRRRYAASAGGSPPDGRPSPEADAPLSARKPIAL
jgi:hypothetical protein